MNIILSSYYGKIRYTISIKQLNLMRQLVALYYGLSEYNEIRKEIHLRKCNYPKQLLKFQDNDEFVNEMVRVKQKIRIKNKQFPCIHKFLLCNQLKFIWEKNEVIHLFNLLNNMDFRNIRNNYVYIDFLNFLKTSIEKKSLIQQKFDKPDFKCMKTIKKLEQNVNIKTYKHSNTYDVYEENKNNYTQAEIDKADGYLNLT
jgi:hypothetical protein